MKPNSIKSFFIFLLFQEKNLQTRRRREAWRTGLKTREEKGRGVNERREEERREEDRRGDKNSPSSLSQPAPV